MRHTVLGSKALKTWEPLGFVRNSINQRFGKGDAPFLCTLSKNGAAKGDALRKGLVSLSAILFFQASQGIDGQPS